MADLLQTPAAAGILPPNPNQGLQTIAGILGIRQAQQNLQTGQFTQQKEQAEAQQQQQSMQERQLLQQTMKSGVRPDNGKSIYKDNNEVDPDQLTDFANRNLPLTGQSVIQNITKTQSDKTALNSAVADLGDKYNNDLSGRIRSFVNNPKAQAADVKSSLQDYARQNPAAASAVLSANNLLDNLDSAAGMKAKNDMLLHLAQQFQPASTTEASQRPSAGVYQGKTGVQAYQNNPLAAGGIQNIGAPLGPQGVAPQMITPPGGNPAPYVPGGSVASPAKGAYATGPTPTDQDLARHNEYENSLNGRVAIASDLLPRLKLTNAAADSIRSGAGTAMRASMAKSLQATGAPQGLVDAVAGGDLAAVQEAEKMMFQTTFSGLRQSMQGDSARVAEFKAAENVFPNVDTDPRARHEILGFMSDQGQRDYAEQQALDKAKTDGTFNPANWQASYQRQLREGKVPGVPASQIPASANEKTVARTGKVRSGPNAGKTKIEYSDGSSEYK